jgi:hypothetical protein
MNGLEVWKKEAALFEWVENFCSGERLHSALGYQSPADVETQLN